MIAPGSSLPAVDETQRFHTLRTFGVVEDRTLDEGPFLESPDALEVDQCPSADSDAGSNPDDGHFDAHQRARDVASEDRSASTAPVGLDVSARERSARAADDGDQGRASGHLASVPLEIQQGSGQ